MRESPPLGLSGTRSSGEPLLSRFRSTSTVPCRYRSRYGPYWIEMLSPIRNSLSDAVVQLKQVTINTKAVNKNKDFFIVNNQGFAQDPHLHWPLYHCVE